MSENTPSKTAGIIALILGMGAVAALCFVYFEPIAAYMRLKAGSYGFSPTETEWMMRGRMREAGIPLIAGSAAGFLAIIVARGRGKLGKTALIFGLASLAAAGYVWAVYGDKIIRAL
ncbi:MAG: hypothetical protein H6706_23045 [Myxococcales bacterium]|nr:hypothetical protein [Myxococcales bacterium]